MAPSPTPPTTISRQLKWLLSVLLLFHLAAVVIPPFTFATRTGYESSPLAQLMMSVVQPYSNALYLNHGYFFFAPSPGPSHLIEYDVPADDGSKETFRIPDRQSQWPRLFYHRHLMLAEWIHSNFPPETVPEWIPPSEKRRLHEVYRQLITSFQQHLQHRHDVHEVTLRRLEHELVYPEEYLSGKHDLFAPELYRPLPLEPGIEEAP